MSEAMLPEQAAPHNDGAAAPGTPESPAVEARGESGEVARGVAGSEAPASPALMRPHTADTPDVASRLAGIEDLSVDAQVAVLASIDADLRAALDRSRG